MAENLGARQASFIAMMGKSPDHANRGFELLSKREDALAYFDALLDAGLLDGSNNPAPVSVEDQPGFVRIPYWRALDFLETLARHSGDKNDLDLARRVLKVVAEVSVATGSEGTGVDNYHTFRKFAEIAGLVPVEAVDDSIVDLVPTWLASKYDSSLAASALSNGLLSNLLSANGKVQIETACRILRFLTEYERASDGDGVEIKTIVDDFWLKEIFDKHIKAFGSHGRDKAAVVLEERLRELFAESQRPFRSSLWRPAIEEHEQNRGYRKAENIFVEGLRDVLLEWTDTGDKAVERYVERLLNDDGAELLQRIALHVIDERYDRYATLLTPEKATRFLADPYRHELYRFLDRHYSDFNNPEKALVLDSIKALKVEGRGENSARRRAYLQRDWCSAIRNKNYQPADDFFEMLDTQEELGELSDHPDFLSFFTLRAGPERSPFTAELLAASIEEGRLVELTSSFKETGSWREPSEEGLWQTLKDVVSAQPDLVVGRLNEYVSAPIPLIHTMISGLSRCLQDADPKVIPNSKIWEALIDYSGKVLDDETFWSAQDADGPNLLPRRSWVLSIIADTLAQGTRTDKTAYPKKLLPSGWKIIQVLLDRCPHIEELQVSDLSMQAINTARGRTIEAAVNHALRVCRLQTKATRSHSAAWKELAPVFDAQLAMTSGSNYEFSLLMAQYLANLDYLSPEWLDRNFHKIFDQNNFDNFRCALAGLAYATLTGRIYSLLVKHDVIATALETKYHKRQEGERLVEFMCLALLWGDEKLDSPRFNKLFERDRETELATATDWFWSVHDGLMPDKKKRIVRQFWAKVLDWSKKRASPPERLLSKLCRLAGYIDVLDDSSTALLKAVAPYAGHDFNVSELIKEMIRLTPTDPIRAASVTEALLSRTKPYHDSRGELRDLLRLLAENGQRETVLRAIDAMARTDPSMVEFYRSIVGDR